MNLVDCYLDAIRMILEADPDLNFYAKGANKSSSLLFLEKVYRGLRNLFPPNRKIDDAYFLLEKEILNYEKTKKGVVKIESLPQTRIPRLALFFGDFTRIEADAVVNEASEDLTGCYVPGHNCIDNQIHSGAGLACRFACYHEFTLKNIKGFPSFVGVSKGYNLANKFIIHAVTPKSSRRPTDHEITLLMKTYKRVFLAARKVKARSLVLPLIGLEENFFSPDEVISIAIDSVIDALYQMDDNLIVAIATDNQEIYEKCYKMLEDD